jgi:hypothetical protein
MGQSKQIKNKSVYITQSLIKNISLSELDFTLQDKFKFSYETHRFIVIPKGGQPIADATPVEIQKLIDILEKAKLKGATHVQIEDHCDHHGYDIAAFEIRLSTEPEIAKHNGEFEKAKEKNRKIEELYSEIKKLQE